MPQANRRNVLVMGQTRGSSGRQPLKGSTQGNTAAHPDGVYLYSHYGGDKVRDAVQAGLTKNKDRWDDSGALGSAIFSEMCNGIGGEPTDFGIYHNPLETDNPTIVVDTNKKQVTTLPPDKMSQVAQGQTDLNTLIGQQANVPFDNFANADSSIWSRIGEPVGASTS